MSAEIPLPHYAQQAAAAEELARSMQDRLLAMADDLRGQGFSVTYEGGSMVVRAPEPGDPTP